MEKVLIRKKKRCWEIFFEASIRKSTTQLTKGRGRALLFVLPSAAMRGICILDLEELKQAKSDMVKRHQIRQKIKACCDHLDKSRYGEDILGLKVARLLRASPKPEPMVHRGGFGRDARR